MKWFAPPFLKSWWCGALLISLLAAGSCVAGDGGDECSAELKDGSGGGGYPPKTKEWGGASSDTLQIFQTERSDDDRVPRDDCEVKDMIEFLDSDPPPFSPPGSAMLSQGRLAIDDLALGRRLFLIPTDTGGLCTVVTGSGGHWGCGQFTNPTWSWVGDPASGPAYAYGNLENGVIEVTCTVSGGETEAVVQNNAFYCELPDEVQAEQPGLIIKYLSGNVRRIKGEHER